MTDNWLRAVYGMDETFKRRWPTLYAAIMQEEGREAKIQRLIDDPRAPAGERRAARAALARVQAANSHSGPEA